MNEFNDGKELLSDCLWMCKKKEILKVLTDAVLLQSFNECFDQFINTPGKRFLWYITLKCLFFF